MSVIQVKVVPKASTDEIVGWMGERLKIRVSAAPERGKANAAVEALLADVLGLPASKVRIVAGATSSFKTLEIDAPGDVVKARLAGSS